MIGCVLDRARLARIRNFEISEGSFGSIHNMRHGMRSSLTNMSSVGVLVAQDKVQSNGICCPECIEYCTSIFLVNLIFCPTVSPEMIADRFESHKIHFWELLTTRFGHLPKHTHTPRLARPTTQPPQLNKQR